MSTRFVNAIGRKNDGTPPVWMMRQAGRYHSHYQGLKRKYDFVTLCKDPDLAAEVALGPMDDFDFDAAILFSDILFPLEAMGQNLTFDPGPRFEFHLESPADLGRYDAREDCAASLSFQGEALRRTRARLSQEKGLIGFVGGLLTLYTFAVAGTHRTGFDAARAGFKDGRFEGLLHLLSPIMLRNMENQARASCDVLAIFDTCAGDVTLDEYRTLYLPFLAALLKGFAALCPATPILYYGKGIGPDHWRLLGSLPVAAIGIDHDQDLAGALKNFGGRFAIQGNFDPHHLTLDEAAFEAKAVEFLETVRRLPEDRRRGWICGLGHGVTPQAREANVRRFIALEREIFKG